MDKETKKERGRPLKVGELVSEYPALMVRVPTITRNRLSVIGNLEARPLWMIVNAALEQYFAAIPKADRDVIDALVERIKAREKK